MLILGTADWHLCKAVPPCRKETEEQWLAFQFSVIEFIFETARKHKAAVCCAGDVFDRSVPGTVVVNRLLALRQKYADVEFYACAGNHETPYHNHKLLEYSAFDTLRKHLSSAIEIGEHDFNSELTVDADIMLCHHLCFPDSEKIPSYFEAMTPTYVAKLYPKSSLIICGDYHALHSHFLKETKQMVVVPGCTTIQDADYINYKPHVLLIDSETFENELIELPNNPEMLSREHVEKEHARNEHIDKFIEMLSGKSTVTLSFRNNLKNKMMGKDIPAPVKTIIQNIQETINGR